MDNLRKFGIVCWDSKERLVLAIVVLVLCFRVSLLINPSRTVDVVKYVSPRQGGEIELDEPPRQPLPPDPLPVTPMLRSPIFDYQRPSARNTGTDSNLSEEDDKVKLLRFMGDGRGGYKAHISTGGARKLLAEGDAFESYTVTNIDYDTKCVTIYSEKSNKQFELCLD